MVNCNTYPPSSSQSKFDFFHKYKQGEKRVYVGLKKSWRKTFRNCLINSNYIPRIVISYLNNISMKTEHTNYPRFIPLRFRLDVNECLPIMLIITT